MRHIVRLGKHLFVDMESGICRRTKMPSESTVEERLTRGQLRILSYLVENREHICETGILQGLFDSSLSGDQTAGIKQQIQRIKNKFKGVDGSFDSRRAREVFKSVPRVGYMFHLPEDGEIIDVGAPSDALRYLDSRWLADVRKMDEERKKEVREAFDRMDSSWENTLYASALGMCVHNSAMRRQLRDFSEFLFREDGMRGIVSIVSVGAEGKTVLLAEFVRLCVESHPNWNLYDLKLSSVEPSPEAIQEIIEYIRQMGIGKIRRSILILDFPDVLDRRFRFLLRKIQELNQSWLYVIFTSRLYDITLAFEQPWAEEFMGKPRLYLLDSEARVKQQDASALYMQEKDGTKRKVEIDWEKIEEIRAKKRLESAKDSLVVVPSVRIKKEVMAGISERCFYRWERIKEVTEKRLMDLPYDEKSYIDLYLMLLGQAGRQSESRRQEFMEQNSCRGNAVWDGWLSTTRILDQNCIGYRVISEMFPYMAVMWIFGIRVTVNFLCRVTGREIQSELRWMLQKSVGNEIYLRNDDSIMPPAKDVLFAYFYMHPDISPERCMQELLQSNWMDAKMLMDVIDKTYLKFMHIDPERIPFSMDLLKLAKVTLRNPLYMKILREEDMADIPALAFLWFTYEPGVFQGTLSRTVISFTSAFERTIEDETSVTTCIIYWLHFLEVAVYYFQTIPDFLMDYYSNQQDSVKEKMLTGVKNSLNNGRYYRENFWKQQMELYFQELQQEHDGKKTIGSKDTLESQSEERSPIAEETNERNDSEKAEHSGRPRVKNRLLNALIGKRQKQLQELSKIAAEEQVLFDLTEASAHKEGTERYEDEKDDSDADLFDFALRANKVMIDYREYRDAMAEAGEQDAVLLVSGRWSMFCYRLGMYEEAQKILSYAVRCLHEALEGMYWIYLLQGRVAEVGGSLSHEKEKPSGNPCYNPKAAERYYRKAYDNYLRYGNQSDLEPFIIILQTLATFYYKQGKKRKEEKVYNEIETRIPSSRIRDAVHGCLED